MRKSRDALPATAAEPELSRERLEESILRAYLELASRPDQPGTRRIISLAKMGALEARLLEVSREDGSHLPPFWVEIYSHASASVVDSYGCDKFNKHELASAVELIMDAKRRQPT